MQLQHVMMSRSFVFFLFSFSVGAMLLFTKAETGLRKEEFHLTVNCSVRSFHDHDQAALGQWWANARSFTS